jgi:hypothetical protein
VLLCAGDIKLDNIDAKWREARFEGSTYISESVHRALCGCVHASCDNPHSSPYFRGSVQCAVVPGWQKLLSVFHADFGDRPGPEKSVMMAVVLSDGEVFDNAEFAAAMRSLPRSVFVIVCVVGCE